MQARTYALTAIAAAILMSGAAHADSLLPLTAQQTMQQMNLVVLGNDTSSSHVDGRSWVGGSVAGNNAVFNMHSDSTPSSSYAGLTVMGVGVASGGAAVSGIQVDSNGAVVNGNITNSTVNKGVSVIHGDSTNTSYNGGSGDSYYVSGAINGGNRNVTRVTTLVPGSVGATSYAAASSTNFGAVLSQASTQLSKLKDTSKTSDVSVKNNVTTFTATAGANGVAVINLDAASAAGWSTSSEFQFNLGNATTVVFNTSLSSATISANFDGGSAQKIGAKVIWNFYDATSLDLTNQFGGQVLATQATLTNGNNIEGGVFVNNLIQNGEIHEQAFTGVLAAVPEPETYAMLLAGLGLVGFMARRRKSASRV